MFGVRGRRKSVRKPPQSQKAIDMRAAPRDGVDGHPATSTLTQIWMAFNRMVDATPARRVLAARRGSAGGPLDVHGRKETSWSRPNGPDVPECRRKLRWWVSVRGAGGERGTHEGAEEVDSAGRNCQGASVASMVARGRGERGDKGITTPDRRTWRHHDWCVATRHEGGLAVVRMNERVADSRPATL